jgi:hypothetical protein
MYAHIAPKFDVQSNFSLGDFPSAPFELLESGELPISHPQHPDLWYST